MFAFFKTQNRSNLYVVIGLVSIIIIPLVFAFNFSSLDFGGTKDWSTFATYFTGVATPILAFLSVVMLYETLNIQKKEMKDATKQLEAAALINQRNLDHQLSLKYLKELSEWVPAAIKEFESLAIQVPTKGNGEKPEPIILVTELNKYREIHGSKAFKIIAGQLIENTSSVQEFRRVCILAHRTLQICVSYLKLDGFFEHQYQSMMRVANYSCNLQSIAREMDMKDWEVKLKESSEELRNLLDRATSGYYERIDLISKRMANDITV